MRLLNRLASRVPPAKIDKYLLNIAHREGGPKARFFLAFGFDAETLSKALVAHAIAHDAHRTTETPHGRLYELRGPVESPDGRNPEIVSVWMVRDDGLPSLVTAYPSRS